MTEIRVPTLGESVTEATIGRWFKKAGDPVAVDEPLVELETDKVTIEVPAPSAGTLGDIIAKDWYKGVASPIRLERSKPSLRSVPPGFSQHAAEVLAEFGYSGDEINALVANGVVCGRERRR